MAEVFVRRRRAHRDRGYGEIPLSAGEIEYLMRQDEAARRRQRLLQVREQEKRVAQMVTQRYRDNLRLLQSQRLRHAKRDHSLQKDVLLSTLHEKYQLSVQGMGTAQRNAREKMIELMELAHIERQKWTVNRHGERERYIEAAEVLEEDEAARLARRQEIERNLQRLKALSAKHRTHASERAKRELELQLQLKVAQEEAQRIRSLHAEREEFSYPKQTTKDVTAYHFTRTHCVAVPSSTSKPVNLRTPDYGTREVKIVRHNRMVPSQASAIDQAEVYRREIEHRREEIGLMKEENTRVAESRGNEALHVIESIREGQQTIDWLTSLKESERHALDAHFSTEVVSRRQRVAGIEEDGSGSEVFARLFGLSDDNDLLSSIEEEETQESTHLPQRLIARRLGSSDASEDSILDSHWQSVNQNIDLEDPSSPLKSVEERAIERKLETMGDMLKRLASFSKAEALNTSKELEKECVDRENPDRSVNMTDRDRFEAWKQQQMPSLERSKDSVEHNVCVEQEERVIDSSDDELPGSDDAGGYLRSIPDIQVTSETDKVTKDIEDHDEIGWIPIHRGSGRVQAQGTEKSTTDLSATDNRKPRDDMIKMTEEDQDGGEDTTKHQDYLHAVTGEKEFATNFQSRANVLQDTRQRMARKDDVHESSSDVSASARRLSIDRLEEQLEAALGRQGPGSRRADHFAPARSSRTVHKYDRRQSDGTSASGAEEPGYHERQWDQSRYQQEPFHSGSRDEYSHSRYDQDSFHSESRDEYGQSRYDQDSFHSESHGDGRRFIPMGRHALSDGRDGSFATFEDLEDVGHNLYGSSRRTSVNNGGARQLEHAGGERSGLFHRQGRLQKATAAPKSTAESTDDRDSAHEDSSGVESRSSTPITRHADFNEQQHFSSRVPTDTSRSRQQDSPPDHRNRVSEKEPVRARRDSTPRQYESDGASQNRRDIRDTSAERVDSEDTSIEHAYGQTDGANKDDEHIARFKSEKNRTEHAYRKAEDSDEDDEDDEHTFFESVRDSESESERHLSRRRESASSRTDINHRSPVEPESKPFQLKEEIDSDRDGTTRRSTVMSELRQASHDESQLEESNRVPRRHSEVLVPPTNPGTGSQVVALDESSDMSDFDPSTTIPDELLRMGALPYTRQMQHEVGMMKSSSSSSRLQYSLPHSDSFSSMDDSFVSVDRDTAVLTNRLLPMFPHHRRQSNESSSASDARRPSLQRQNPAKPETTIVLNGLRQQSNGDRGSTSTPDVLRSHLASGSMEDTPMAAQAGATPLRGIQNRVTGGEQRLEQVDLSELEARSRQTQNVSHRSVGLQDLSFSSDTSSDMSAYIYLTRMRQVASGSAASKRPQGSQGVRSSQDSSSDDNKALPRGAPVQAPMEYERDARRRDSNVSSSSSTPSINARFQYLVNMTAVTGKALPLHLNLPSSAFSSRDMSVPPPNMHRASPSESSEADSETQGKQLPLQSASDGSEIMEQSTRETATSMLPAAPFGFLDMRTPPARLFTSSSSRSSQVDGHDEEAQSHSSDQQRVASKSGTPDSGDAPRQFDLDTLKERLATLPSQPFGALDMSQPPPPLLWNDSEHESSVVGDDAVGDTASELRSSAVSHASSVPSGVRRKAEALFIPLTESGEESAAGGLVNVSLADAFRQRHPKLTRRIDTASLLEKRRSQLEAQRAAVSQERPRISTASPQRQNRRASVASQSPSTTLSMPKPELLDRLASGARAKITAHEMKERTRRLYSQLPEVAERKRQEDVMERRRQRLAELREREKARRQQQHQRQERA